MNTHLETLKDAIRNAWRTLAMLPDPDARFRRAFGNGWVLPTIRSVKDGDYPAEIYTKPVPSPHEITEMETVFEWLVWLRCQRPPEGGEFSLKRLAAWSWGQPVWRMAQREQVSERTIHRRINLSVAKILARFKGEEVVLPPIYEMEPRPERIRGFTEMATAEEQAAFESPDTLEPGRVYIEGLGMMFRGEKYRSPLDADARELGRRRR